MRIGLLAGAVGLAMGLPALAAESKTDIREFNPDGTPVTPEFPVVTGKISGRNALDLSSRFGTVSRGVSNGDGAPDRATMTEGFESLTELPAVLTNQLSTVTWGGSASSVTGKNHFAAPTAGWSVPGFGVTSEAVSGNLTKKLRGFVQTGQGSPSPFFGRFARYDLYKFNGVNPGQGTRFAFSPDTDDICRVEHDTFVTAITSLWTSEPTYVAAGFIIGRLLWGGENATTGIGLPTGAIPDFYTLGINPNAFLTGIFVPCETPSNYRNGPAYPGGAGQLVPVPTGLWFKVIHETDTSGNLVHVLDKNDGNGEYVVYTDPAIVAAGRMDRIAFSGDQAVTNDAMYIDNLLWSGVQFILPIAPALDCSGGAFNDDQDWLFDGALIGQSTAYVDFLSSRGEVLAVGDSRNNFPTKAIYRENWAPDDRYRKEIHRLLPTVVASAIGPYQVCQAMRLLNSGGYFTAQSIAPASVTDGDFVTRMMIGFSTGPFSAGYTSRIYIQNNSAYNPIDDEATTDPFVAGPGGNGGVPVVGTDIVDTGVNWTFNSNRTVCFSVDVALNLGVTINAVSIHTGNSFVNSLDRMDWESENSSGGSLNQIVYDNIDVICTVIPPVTLPPFTLVYNDNLEWGFDGVSIDLHDDDNNAFTPFRWSSAANMPIVSLPVDGSSKVLKMENLFRDTPPSLPNIPPDPTVPSGFFQFTQASTGLPSVTASGTRGWVAKHSDNLTDTETSRIWSVASATVDPNLFARVGALVFSSVTDTFWFQDMDTSTPAPDDTTWFDTGSGLATYGLSLNQWFSLSMHKSLAGPVHWQIGAIAHTSPANATQFLRNTTSGDVVLVNSLTSTVNGVHKNMDRLFYLGSDEDSAPVGSILYTDNIRAWSLPCLGDTDNNGVVDFADLNNILSFFGSTSTAATGVNLAGNVAPDANNDNVPDDEDAGAGFLYDVDFGDLNAVLSGFGLPCTATN